MPVTLSAAVPVLLSVTLCAALVVFTSWLANVRLVGERLTKGAVPVPVRLTMCGLPAALSVMVIAPVRVPVAVGGKVTLMVQLAPAAERKGVVEGKGWDLGGPGPVKKKKT